MVHFLYYLIWGELLLFGTGLGLIGTRFGFFDSGLNGSGFVFIDTNFGSIVSRMGIMCFGL